METPSFMGLVSRFWRVFLPRGKCMSLTKCWNQTWLRPRSTIPLPRALLKVGHLMLSFKCNGHWFRIFRCALWIQWNNLCVWPNIKWKNAHHGGNYWRPQYAGHHTQVGYIIKIMNSKSHLLFAGLSTTSSIISIQWKRTLSSTSRCPTLRSTWTNAGISLTVSRHQFEQKRNNLGFFCSFQGQPGRPWRQGPPSLRKSMWILS